MRFSNYKESEYTKLTNMPIGTNFTADDEGVSIGGFGICEPITIKSISINRDTDEEFVELEFYILTNNGTKKISRTIASDKLLKQEGQKILAKTGFVILDPNKFNSFLGMSLIAIKRLAATNETNIKIIYGSAQYGFEVIDGVKNFDNFYGIDLPVIPTENMEAIDNTMFKEKGTLEGYINYAEKLASTSKCKKLIQLTMAMGLTGITRQFLGGTVPVPEYVVQSPSGSGKGFLQNLIAAQFGRVAGSGLIYSGSSSIAGMKPIKSKINIPGVMLEDMQQKIDSGNRGEIEELRQMIYEHTNGVSTKKANGDGTVRGDNYKWECPLIMYNEKELPDNIKDGAANRYITLRSGLKCGKNVEQEYIWGKLNKSQIDKEQHENYGHYAKEYIKKIVQYNKENDMSAEFNKMEDEIDDMIQANSKKLAGLYGLLLYTYNLLYKFKMLPKSWSDLTVEDITEYHDGAKINSSDETIYEMFKERIASQSDVYLPYDEKLTQKDYNERKANGQQVRGRIKTIEDNGIMKTVVIIPKAAFDENLKDIAKRHEYSYKTNVKSWVDNGWIIPSNNIAKNGYVVKAKNITYEYNAKGEGISRKIESCYQVVIDEYINEGTAKMLDEDIHKAYKEILREGLDEYAKMALNSKMELN